LIDEAVRWGGRIDVLVCNAGYGLVRPVAETSAEEMREIFETNVFGTTDCVRAAVPYMRKQEKREGLRGHVVIVSSAAGRRGLPYFGAYSATKAAQLSLAEALRVELKPERIAVTSVHPVGTKTDFFTTAETRCHTRLPKRHDAEVVQTPEQVARKIVRAIERPRAEVWPLGIARLGLSAATLVPGMVDRVLAKRVPME
jgi:short-subunit dehydrogenase